MFVDNGITPVELVNGNGVINALFKSSESQKLDFVIQNKLGDCEVLSEKISRISIIGYGISNDTNILKRVISILECEKDNIKEIDVNNGKIRATFKGVVDNTILERIHDELVEVSN